MTDLFGPDKEFLRRNLPLTEVARQLTKDYGCKGPHILSDGTALCPFHDDTNESFYLWDGDDGVPRWWCQPCGYGGDIFDLIRRSLQVSFPESEAIAQRMFGKMPPGYVPPKVERSRPVSMDEWFNSIEVAQRYAATRAGVLSMMAGFVAARESQATALAWDEYLRDRWLWGLVPPEGANGPGVVRGNSILLPHYYLPEDDPSAWQISGCKTRTGPSKGSLPGSRYIALYGAWLGRQARDVLLLEGETDTIYAAHQAAEESIPLDCYGLPSGAHRNPLQEHADFLQGSGTVYLAFDPDEAGVSATRAWLAFLIHRGFQDVRVCSLPHKTDLREARPTVRHLLDYARAPVIYPSRVQRLPGGYVHETGKTDDNGNAITDESTNWTMRVAARLSGGEPGYAVTVETRGGCKDEDILLSELSDMRLFKKWANHRGLIFTGSDTQRKDIEEETEWQGSTCPEVYQTDTVGARAAPEAYAFAGESFVYPDGHIGKLPWRYVVNSKESPVDVSGRILLPYEGGFEWEWLDAFLRLSTPDVMHPILSWIVASTRRHTVRNFPLLYIGGSSGVGKSTLARLGMHLAGSDIEVNLGAVTPFVLTKTLASTTNMPVFVDEWTLLSRQDTLEQFQGAIPLLYAGERADRGTSDLALITYRQTAPTIIAGEQELGLDREIDRMVTVFPARATQSYADLARIEHKPLQGFGQALHHFLLRAENIVPLDYAPAASRPVYNEQVLRAGWAILQAFLHEAAHGGENVPDIPHEPDLSCFAKVQEDREHENIYEQALYSGLPMRDQNSVPVVWADPDGTGTWVRVRELIGLIRSRRLEMQLPGGERAMLRYFEERHKVQKSLDVRPPGGTIYVRAAFIAGLHVVTPEAVPAEEALFT